MNERDKIHEYLDSLTPEQRAKLEERFYSKVRINEETGCHEWTAYKQRDGYGKFWMMGTMVQAHRFAFALAGHVLLKWTAGGMTLDHVCRNPSCVNPKHLRQVTQKENINASPLIKDVLKRGRANGARARRRKLSRTHCKHGHEFSHAYQLRSGRDEGTWKLFCKHCQQETIRRRKAKKARTQKPPTSIPTT